MTRTTSTPMEGEESQRAYAAASPHRSFVGLWIVVGVIIAGALVVAFASEGAAGLPPVIATVGVPVVCAAGIVTIVILRVSLFYSERRLHRRIEERRKEAKSAYESYRSDAAAFRVKAAKQVGP